MIKFFLIFLFLVFVTPIGAIYDPLSVPNNRYGMHVADFSDIADVATLVNSNGGDWGYITIVASDNDRDTARWQRMFDQMRRVHLIPIVRIATHVSGSHWVKPDPARFEEVVDFFQSLNWPVKNRYVVLFNEPNHANEWGQSINPEEYAEMFMNLARKFKGASDDFFILPAGLDVSAASDGLSLEAGEYLRRIVHAQPDFLTIIDGWTSHSYPNPGFSGSPHGVGRGSIRSFEWEISYLESLGLKRRLSVFITETGWVHQDGVNFRGGMLSPDTVGSYLRIAATGAWANPNLVAITPFVFNYQDIPFDSFSWKRLSRIGGFYPHYDAYFALSKTQGQPIQDHSYALVNTLLPPTLVAGSTYTLKAKVKNEGQGILNSNDFDLAFEGEQKGFTLIADSLPTLEPKEEGEITVHLRIPDETGIHRMALVIRHNGRTIPLQLQDILIVPPPALTISPILGFKAGRNATDVSVLVYDDTKLLHKFSGLRMKDGKVSVSGISGIIPGRPYRVVLLVPYYLPRQTIWPLEAGETQVRMKRLYPLDFNLDGAFTFVDFFLMVKIPPFTMLYRFIGL